MTGAEKYLINEIDTMAERTRAYTYGCFIKDEAILMVKDTIIEWLESDDGRLGNYSVLIERLNNLHTIQEQTKSAEMKDFKLGSKVIDKTN